MKGPRDHMPAIAHTLGDVTRDFMKNPLTQGEIESVVYCYTEELKRRDLHPDLRDLYAKCLEILKKYLVFH